MKKFILFLTISILIPQIVCAQGTAGENAKYEYRQLIDMPTAGVIQKGSFGLNTELLPQGTLLVKLEAGILENLSFGISYGGSNIIGSGNIDWYPFPPGVNLRFRLFDESLVIPAITLGFDTQGKGQYYEDVNRYEIKAPGIFAAACKNFSVLGYLSLHGEVNYSILEDDDGDNFVNLMVGAEKTIGSSFSVIAEYNFAFNDNSTDEFGEGKGYLNMGIRWSISDGVTFGFDLRDLLGNDSFDTNSADRGMVIEFIQKI
jgi:hypothetical protein